MLSLVIDNVEVERRDISLDDIPEHKRHLWRPLEIIDPPFNKLTQTRVGPSIQILDDKVVETWEVADRSVEQVKTMLLDRVDGDAESIRLKYITAGDGMMMTYREKLEQAEQAVGQGQSSIDALTEDEGRSAYPTLAASVGIEGSSLWECAQLVLSHYEQWAKLSHFIEKTRLTGKKAITDSASVDDARAAYDAIDWGAL